MPFNKSQFLIELKAVWILDEVGKWNKDTKKHEACDRFPTVFEREGKIFVSAEDGGYFVNYYGQYDDGGACWIHEDIEDVAKKFNGYWEWENPACIYFCEK